VNVGKKLFFFFLQMSLKEGVLLLPSILNIRKPARQVQQCAELSSNAHATKFQVTFGFFSEQSYRKVWMEDSIH
jgi:hypothetical protein